MSENQQNTNVPSAARLQRIEMYLADEPAYKPHLGPKDVKVTKRSGETVKFNQGVVKVGVAIQNDGKDAVTLSKKDIFAYADKVFGSGVGQAEYPAPAVEDAGGEAEAETSSVEAAPEKPEKSEKVEKKAVDEGGLAPEISDKMDYRMPALACLSAGLRIMKLMKGDACKEAIKKVQSVIQELSDQR